MNRMTPLRVMPVPAPAGDRGELREQLLEREAVADERSRLAQERRQLERDRASFEEEREERIEQQRVEQRTEQRRTEAIAVGHHQPSHLARLIIAAGRKRRGELVDTPALPSNPKARAITLSGRRARGETLDPADERWLADYLGKIEATQGLLLR